MSDFCLQCSIKHFGKDMGDLKGLSTKEDTRKGKYPMIVCEGCGPIQVDHTGRCVSTDCLEGHNLWITTSSETWGFV